MDRACVREDASMGFHGLSTLHPPRLLKRREADMTHAGFLYRHTALETGTDIASSVMKDLSIICCSVSLNKLQLYLTLWKDVTEKL